MCAASFGADGPAAVVLVEDDAGDAFLVQELLGRHEGEFALTWVRSLVEARAAIGPGTDCVLLDLGLPDTDGLDGVQAVLALGTRAAVVVLTGFDDRASGGKALALGAQDYLSKDSVDDETLARSLRYAIARRQSEEASRRLREAELVGAENSRLERGLLPHPLIFNPRLSWATRYEPGGGRALLGGDFFDAVELDDGTVRAVIGDVSGHGPDEAALGVALRVAWRALVLASQTPDATLAALERVLEAERFNDEVFATVCDIEINSALDAAEIHLCGHPAPLLFDGNRVSEVPVPIRSPMLGAVAGAEWHAVPVRLGSDWTLVAYTDGIIEARVGDGSARLGTDGLVQLATRELQRPAATLESVATEVIAGAEQANGAPLNDDAALVLLSADPRWTM